ncbi:MAG: mechanosensitive ion channel [Candidatus Nanohaloarchaea archaeon]|nr:mechanosensitive ion channel [Candidatus Nanohaloarchaea archaeon]
MAAIGRLLDQAWNSLIGLFQTGGFTRTEVVSIAVIVVVGILGGRIASEIIRRLLKMTALDDISVKSNVQSFIRKIGYSGTVSDLISDLVRYFIYLLVLLAVFSLLGMEFFINNMKTILSVLPRVLIAVLALIFGFIVSSYLNSIIVKVFRAGPIAEEIDDSEPTIPVYRILGKFVKWVGYIASVLIFLSILGVNTIIMTMLIGILFLGLVAVFVISGKDLMRNFAISIHLQLSDELNAGDYIKIRGAEGKINKITPLYTKIKEGQEAYYIPNEELLRNILEHEKKER